MWLSSHCYEGNYRREPSTQMKAILREKKEKERSLEANNVSQGKMVVGENSKWELFNRMLKYCWAIGVEETMGVNVWRLMDSVFKKSKAALKAI